MCSRTLNIQFDVEQSRFPMEKGGGLIFANISSFGRGRIFTFGGVYRAVVKFGGVQVLLVLMSNPQVKKE